MKNAYRILGSVLQVRDQLRYSPVYGAVILKMGWKGEDWKLIADNSGQWQVLVNAAMAVRVP